MMPREYYAKYDDIVSVACINYKTIWGDKAANLKKMKTKVVEAVEMGNNIIAFPELALSGYECTDKCTMHAEAAETVPGPSTEEMAELARKYGVYIVFGMPERDKKENGVRYISSAVVGPEGVLGAYRKLHLASAAPYKENLCFKTGNQLPVFETKYGPIGIQICLDFWYFPEQSRVLAMKGARLIINTSGSLSGPGKPYFIVQQTGARATENSIYCASANMVGTELTASFYGHSVIAGPAPPRRVQIYAEGGETEEIVSATLNFKRLWRIRERVPYEQNINSVLAELKKVMESTIKT